MPDNIDVIARPGLMVWFGSDHHGDKLGTISVVRSESCDVLDDKGTVTTCRFYNQKPWAAEGMYCYPQRDHGIPVMASSVTVKGKGLKYA